MALSLSDLRYLYYGGGSDAEMAFLQQAFDAGVSAVDLLESLEHNHDGTYVAGTVLAESVLSADAASIDFASIPDTYRTLVLDVRLRGALSANATALQGRFNNDSGTNYDRQRLLGNAAGASADALVGQTSVRLGAAPAGTATAGKAGIVRVVIPSYAGTTFHKTARSSASWAVGETSSDIFVEESTVVWRSTAAINRITIFPFSGDFLAGTVATLTAYKGASA